jgi:hypothetical protein
MEQKQEASAAPHGCFFCTVAAPQIEAMLAHCWPEQAQEHFKNARLEMLKGIRTLVDSRIEKLSRTEQKGAKITVE